VSAPPLDDVRVLDLSSGVAGAYLTKLFADAGAEVTKIEAPDGDPLRRWSASATPIAPGADGAYFRFLAAGKRSVVADVATAAGRDLVLGLAAGADLVVESFGPGRADALGLGHDALSAVHPGVTLVSLSAFGDGGPWARRRADDFTLQAQCGSTDFRGLPGEEPASVGGRIGDLTAASFAAPAALAYVRRARAHGRGAHLDVSQFEAMLLSFQTYRPIFAMFDPGRDTPRSIEIPSIEPAADGFVGFCTITRQQYTDFCHLVGAPELAEDPAYASFDKRMQRRAEVWPKIHAYTARTPAAEIVDVASAMRIPVAAVGDGPTVLANEHFAARGVYVDSPHGFRAPRPPFRFGGSSLRGVPAAVAPALGEHDDEVAAELAARPAHAARAAASSAPARDPRRPLEGIRIADFGVFWAGPIAANVLANLGAQLVKIESIQRPDGMRYSSGLSKPDLWEWSPVFHGANPGKRAITLDLDSPEGLALARRIVDEADVVLENFSPRVMDHFGLGWEAVHARNPRAVMCRMPAFGLDGPWRDRVGFAMTIEQVSGLAFTTGHPDGPPLVPRGLVDPVGGMHAAFAVLVALAERDRTGEGQLVEVPLVEVGLNLAAEQAVEYSATGVVLQRTGNRSSAAAPQGIYESADADRWVALSVHDDEQWAALVRLLGEPGWATDPALAGAEARHGAHDVIDEHLRAWFRTRPQVLVAVQLLAAGVTAAPVVNGRLSGDSPHLAARGFFQWERHPVTGWVPYPRFPWRVDGGYLPHAGPAPTLGQHNDEILGGEYGLSVEALADLRARRIIGDRPAGA